MNVTVQMRNEDPKEYQNVEYVKEDSGQVVIKGESGILAILKKAEIERLEGREGS